jgi:signal peptidase I
MFRRQLPRELLQTLILTLAIFLVVKLAVQNFRVDGESMLPNLHNGEYILVDKVTYAVSSPRRGDIVVFRAVPAQEPNKDFIKRIIGLPGETVSVHNNTVYINGHVLREPYHHLPSNYSFGPRTVPPGQYFVLGDHRGNSDDSHMWTSTWLPRKEIIGQAMVSYWPPSDAHVFVGLPEIHLGR